MKELWRRLEHYLHREQFNRELEEEIRDHLARRTADGATADEARRRFGNVTSTLESSRESWSWTWLDQLSQDVRYALRTMSANRLFTLMAVTSLALGIGANTAIYSFMDAILVRSLPVDRPEQLVILNWTAKGEAPVVSSHWGESYKESNGGSISPNFPYGFLRTIENNAAMSDVFGYAEAGRLNMVVDRQAAIVNGECVGGRYFSGLGVPAAAGRLIGPDDDRPGAPAVVMLAFDYWQAKFASDPSVAGKPALINNTPVTIVGVTAPAFHGVTPETKADIFVPLSQLGIVRQTPDVRAMKEDPHYYWVEIMGRLKPGVTLEAAQAQLAGPFHSFVESSATTDRERADLPALKLTPGGSGVDSIRRRYSKPLWLLMGMVGLILLIACANVANLQSARAAARQREIAVRLGLGAGRLRVIRQLLTENILLALAGGVAGLGVAAAGIRLLRPLIAGEDGLGVQVGLDWRVLVFTLTVAMAAGIGFGLAPAFHTTRIDLTPALRSTRASASRQKLRLSHLLVTGQIALSLLLVVAAGLFVRTLTNLHAVNLGFNPEHVLTFGLDASRAGYRGDALKAFYRQVEARLQTTPGVTGATTSDMPVAGGWSSRTSIRGAGLPVAREGQRGPTSSYMQVGPTFFETMQVPIVAGRALDRRDVAGAPAVAVVNQVFVDQYFPGQNPLGRHFTLGGDPAGVDLEIVGVSRTARYQTLKKEAPPVTYVAWSQMPPERGLGALFFEVRAQSDPLALATTVREIVREASPLVPVQELTTQTRILDRTIQQERTFAKLATCFGALALLMACVGLYGTMAYSVAQRTNEIGIRMALGAERGSIVWMVLREVLVLCVTGAAIGAVAVYEGTAVVESFLFGMKPNDPAALTVSATVLFGCALVAGWVPARRASKIDPMVALRHE